MNIVFTLNGWEDFTYWQGTDKKMIRKINELIRDTLRHTFEGIGKPEPLKGNLSGWWSRRITQEHRLVYKVENDQLIINQCRKHY